MSDNKEKPGSGLIDSFGRPIAGQKKEKLGEIAKRKVNNIAAMIVGVSALIAAIVALIVNFDDLCERFCAPEPEPVPNLERFLAADYWRMTGAFEVPFFFLEGPSIAKCTNPKETQINRANCVYSTEIGEVWRTELSESMLVDDGLFSQTDIMAGLRELWFSTRSLEVVDEVYCAIIKMDGGINLQLDDNRTLTRDTIDIYLGQDINSDRLSIPLSNVPDCAGEPSRNIGYLIYRLRNVTDKAITDIQISYHNFPSSDPVASGRSQGELLLESLRSHNPRNFSEWLEAVEDSDLLIEIEKAEITRSDLPDLLPNQSLLIPIYLFRANQDGFEDYFYREWRLPIEVTFYTGDQRITTSATFPRRDAAAVVRTYNGWYQQ